MIGIIGGSGLYDIEELREARDEEVATPFAAEKVRVRRGRLGDVPVAFLARHGPGHRYPPGDVAYRANLDALKRIGVTDVVSLSACGSLREELSPGTFVLVDQFVDRTRDRPHSFFEPGLVAHVSLAHPTCARLRGVLHEVASALPVPVVAGATYLAMEGPQFSTLAESRLYRTWGCDVIGMTNMPEARLAREAELCYATVAMVTDYDCWHEEHGAATVGQILEVLTRNAQHARDLVAAAAPRLAARPTPCPHGCDRALDGAVITAPEARDPEVVRKLDAVAGRVLRG